MSTNIITSSVLKKLLSLQEKKENLSEQIALIDKQMEQTLTGKISGKITGKSVEASEVKSSSVKKAKGKNSKRGATGVKIISALKAAGAKGMSVRDLAEATGVKAQNLHVWFNTTGKKRDDVKKIGTALYRLV